MEQKFDKTTKYVLEYDGKFMIGTTLYDHSAISDDAVGNVTADLNDNGDELAYSEEQVKDALWKFLNEEIDNLLENIEEAFMRTENQGARGMRFTSRREQLLGYPKRNLREEHAEIGI